MAFLLGCEKVRVEFPTKTVFDNVSLGIDEGDRIGIVGRNGDGKSTLLSLLSGALEPDEGRVVRNGSVRVGLLGQTDGLHDREALPRGRRPRIRVGRRRAHPRHPGRPRFRHPVGGGDRHALGRAAPPRRPGAAAHRRLGRARPGRAHQPSGHPRDLVAGGAPQETLETRRGRASGRHARPLVPRRGVPEHVGGARPACGAFRGRLFRLHPATRRTPARGGARGGEAAERAAPRARVALTRGAGALDQAEVPRGGGARAHRRRAGAAQPHRAQAHGDGAPGQAGRGDEAGDGSLRRADGARRARLDHRAR